MLGKLLKYEIPIMGRKLGPLYLAWLATAVFMGLIMGRANDSMGFIGIISILLFVAVSTAVVVMAIVLVIQRYTNDLLGDSGYFSHVLPVEPGTHILNKTISAVIWIIISTIAALVTAVVVSIAAGDMDAFTQGLIDFFKGITSSDVGLLIEFLILALLSCAKSVLAIYAAITIGHQAKNHRILCSIGAYIGVLVFESVLGNIMIHVLSLAELDLTSIHSLAGVQGFMAILFAFTIAIGCVYFFVTRYLMKNRLNLA